MIKPLVYILLTLLLTSCGRDGIETYEIPKEQSASAPKPAPQPRPAPAHKEFSAKLPAGWSEKASSSAMRKASYSIEGTSIDFYLISLSMGDVLSNVNRWRSQIGLPTTGASELANELITFKVDQHTTNLIELYNPEGGTGIIAAIIDLEPTYWYFTAKGPVKELQQHAAEIRTFLESITFEEHSH